MKEYFESYQLISDINDLLDKFAEEKLVTPSLETISKLEKQKNELETFRDEMLRFGFNAPYKMLMDTHENLRLMKKENPVVYMEELPAILAGLKIMRYEAFVKATTLERVRTAINAHTLLIGQIKEMQNGSVFDNVLNFSNLGGTWEAELSELGGFSKMAYFRLIELMSRIEEHTEAIVEFIIKFEDENQIDGKEKLPAKCNIDEELKKKYGNKIEITKVTLTGEKRGIVKDQYSRTNLAYIFTKSTYEKASQRTISELKGKVNESVMQKYDSILRRLPIHETDGSVDLEEIEKLKDALDDANFLNGQGEVKPEIVEQNVLRARTLIKNYHVYSWAALAKNLYLYYLTKSRKDRSETGPFPGTKIELKGRDFELFEVLENEKLEPALINIGLPKTLTGAIDALKEKLDKEVDSKVPAKYLGGLTLFAHTNVGLREICKMLDLTESKIKEYAVQSRVKFNPEKEKDLSVEIKTKKAKDFVNALKGE